MQNDEMLTTTQLAAELSFPTQTLSYWRSIGKGPAYIKIGRWVRYRRTQIDEWIAEQNPDA